MSDNNVKHSKPISIPTHSRRPSSLSSSSEDEGNSPPLQTPTSPGPSPHVRTAQGPVSPSTSTSPILSYFFSSPPKSASAAGGVPTSPTVPFGSLGRQFPFGPRASAEPATVMEEDEDAAEPAIVKHARRLSSTAWPPSGPASRFGGGGVGATNGNTGPPPTAEQQERGAGIFRRLSLGGALARVCLRFQNFSLSPAVSAPITYLSICLLLTAPDPHPSIRNGQAAHGECPTARGLSPRHVAFRPRRCVSSA